MQNPTQNDDAAADKKTPTGPNDKDQNTAGNEPAAAMKEDEKVFAECLSQLQRMGASFRRLDTIRDGNGCGIDQPVAVSEILPGITLAPEGTMRCETALQLGLWMRDMVLPAAKIAAPQDRVTGIRQASTYVCRKRNGAETGKISEHARGNAVDIAAFELNGGKTVTMSPRTNDPTLEGAFQRTVTSAACLYFTTVLSPGSDAAHQDHLHLDTIKRKGGYRYCR